MKKLLYITFMILFYFFIDLNITYAEVDYNFDVSYQKDKVTASDKSSAMKIKVKSNESTDGILVCFFTITTDRGLSITNAKVSENNWNLTKDDDNNAYLFNIKNSKGLLSSEEVNLYEFTVIANNAGRVYIKNIKCANSKEETSKDDIIVKLEFVDDTSKNPSTTETTNNPKTGGKNIIIILMILLLSLLMAYFTYKYNKKQKNKTL